jgi:predicted NAD-dependent protein-ADP-ribosyltransferase YbiA (DUF1768 family)
MPRRSEALLGLLLVVGCASSDPPPAQPKTESRPYPAAWFAPLTSGTKAYSWEITPDAAGPGEVILSKRTELGVFSNLGATPFELDGRCYGSVEGLWQSLYFPENDEDPRHKCGPFAHTRAEVEALSGFEAKRAGDDAKKRLHAAGIDWASYGGRRFDPHGSPEDQAYHLDIIERATRAKVDQNPDVKKLLLATGDLVLRPDHHQGENATPAYRYFDILMKIRAELRAGK